MKVCIMYRAKRLLINVDDAIFTDMGNNIYMTKHNIYITTKNATIKKEFMNDYFNLYYSINNILYLALTNRDEDDTLKNGIKTIKKASSSIDKRVKSGEFDDYINLLTQSREERLLILNDIIDEDNKIKEQKRIKEETERIERERLEREQYNNEMDELGKLVVENQKIDGEDLYKLLKHHNIPVHPRTASFLMGKVNTINADGYSYFGKSSSNLVIELYEELRNKIINER